MDKVDKIFDSLFDVGRKKAVGYLPLETIRSYGKGILTANKLILWAYKNKLKPKIYKHGHTGSGALYIWDENMLRELLNIYRDILINANIPPTTDEYIRYI